MQPSRLIALLCCPETRQPVHEADPVLIQTLNVEIAAGKVKDRSGRVVKEPMESGLLRADGQVLYPIRKAIPIMLSESAIVIGKADRQ